MYSEDDLIPISALQHFAFCERQWGLIHLEGQWLDNRLTAEGTILHSRVDNSSFETRRGKHVAYSLRVRSLRLGLVGKADAVEFMQLPTEREKSSHGTTLPNRPGTWTVHPVEFKRGRPKKNDVDRIQLCAQALCLEEMMHVSIDAGSIYYWTPRRREPVSLDSELRTATKDLIAQVRTHAEAAVTPRASYQKKCNRCSLIDVCLPKVLTGTQDVAGYVSRFLHGSAD